MKTYNEIVDNLENLEKETPKNIANALTEAKSYTDTEVADGVEEAKQYADSKFSAGLKRQVVLSLPVEDIDENTIYMVLNSQSTQQGNVYEEYLYVNSNWELIGTTESSGASLYRHNLQVVIVGFATVNFSYVSTISEPITTIQVLTKDILDRGYYETHPMYYAYYNTGTSKFIENLVFGVNNNSGRVRQLVDGVLVGTGDLNADHVSTINDYVYPY